MKEAISLDTIEKILDIVYANSVCDIFDEDEIIKALKKEFKIQ